MINENMGIGTGPANLAFAILTTLNDSRDQVIVFEHSTSNKHDKNNSDACSSPHRCYAKLFIQLNNKLWT